MQNPQPAVAFRGISKSYDGTSLVVRNLDLTVEAGSFFTMLGPSGSGKTTSLMMLAGFETPTDGEIFIHGAGMKHVPAHERGIGMVFQSYALFPHMTVAENLAFPLTVRKLARSRVEETVARIVSIMQLDGFENRRPAHLSGGQQQRVALGRALVFEPKLVLMDEPLGALDKQLRESMQQEIKRIARSLGITVIYVTHDQSEALTMSDTIAVFNNGRVEQTASPAELYDTPINSFVANFIGENNGLVGTVVGIKDERATVRLHDGSHVDARRVNGATIGEKSRISIRPERVMLHAKWSGSNSHTRKAQVLDQHFMGDVIRTRLRVADNDDFIIKTSNGPGQVPVSPGQQVDISWMWEDCRALDV